MKTQDVIDNKKCERLMLQINTLMRKNKVTIPEGLKIMGDSLNLTVQICFCEGDPVAAALWNAETFRQWAQEMKRQQCN
jgi:hypothetical protein